MALKIQTKVWEKKEWQKLFERVCFAYGIFSIANLIAGVQLKIYPLVVINIIPAILTALITISYNKWKKTKGENNEEKP